MSTTTLSVVVAPNALKGSLSANAAAQAIAAGVLQAQPEAVVRQLPIADGGDGVVEVLQQILKTESITVTVQDPLGRPIDATFLYSSQQQSAFIEMALASGLALLQESERNPLIASSYGLGELIIAAVNHGAKKLIIGIGGSATNDGGMGMAAALGVVFYNQNGDILPANGANLQHISRIECSMMDQRLRQIEVDVICDVENRLLGTHGATAVFGKQKGVTEQNFSQLEQGLANLAGRFESDLSKNVLSLAGGGAAGGVGAALYALLEAKLLPGAELVLDLLDIDSMLQSADLVITAEGALDNQTLHGKAPAAVAARAKSHGIPCIALCGAMLADDSTLQQCGITAAFSITPAPVTLQQSMHQAADFLTAVSRQAVNCFLVGYSRSIK